jgi:WD40 repeat protein
MRNFPSQIRYSTILFFIIAAMGFTTQKIQGEQANYQGITAPIQAVAWHPNGDRLAVATMSDEVWIYNDTLQPIVQIPVEPGLSTRGLAWSPNGAMLAVSTHSGGRDARIFVWDVNTMSQVITFSKIKLSITNL